MTADVLIPTALVTFAAVVVAYLLGCRDRTTETALADRDVAERVAATIYDALEEWSLTVAETPQDEEIVAARTLFLTRRLTGVRLDAVPLDLDLPPASSVEIESILDHRDGVHANPCAYPTRDDGASVTETRENLPHADVAALGRHLHTVLSTRDRARRELANLSPLDVDLDALVTVAKAHVPGDLLRSLAKAAEGDGDLPHLISADEQRALNLIRAATLPDHEAYLTVLAQAATIAQCGGISTGKVEAPLCLAMSGRATPAVQRCLEKEGISVATSLPGDVAPCSPPGDRAGQVGQ